MMKASFSLSSLQGCKTPDKCIKSRPYNSLTKKRKETNLLYRRSWGSTASEHIFDFWSALQANYNYIMDNQLIDNCQEANGELNLSSSTWSLKEFYTQFSELYSWLNSVQEAVYDIEEPLNKVMRAHYLTEILKKNSLRKVLNDQATDITQLYPNVQEEILLRVRQLNEDWDNIETTLRPCDSTLCQQDICFDINHEMKRLRKWIETMEACLQPLVFQVKWTNAEVEKKALEHKVLHRDIENHGKIVNTVVRLCKRSDAGCKIVNAGRVAKGLERRWHLLFLRSLEWQCYFEYLSTNGNQKNENNQSNSGSDFDEPVAKTPRLSASFHVYRASSSDEWYSEDEIEGGNNSPARNRKMIKTKTKKNTKKVVDSPMPVSFKAVEDSSYFTRTNRRAPNLGTYYFKHEDTDSDIDKLKQGNLKDMEIPVTMEETSEDEWTYSGNKTVVSKDQSGTLNVLPKPPRSDIRKLVLKAEELVRDSPTKRAQSQNDLPFNKISLVKQWLDMKKPDDSCDASCEDEEKDSTSSEDLNDSISTYRGRFASQDTLDTELEGGDSNVILRQNQLGLKRIRPWSMSGISQFSQSPRKENGDSPSLSISESALHQLLTPQAVKILNASAGSACIQRNNSTSSTIEECSGTVLDDKNTPVRRKRLKLKKKSNCSPQTALVKSGSFSGHSRNCKLLNCERHTVSDPSAVANSPQEIRYASTSETESEDRKSRRLPVFKVGAKTTYPKLIKEEGIPGKTPEEQSSSFSEQAWDSYQEKYLSEAYSEAHDSDAARRLLEFGEDYRNFLDSQSDWSNQSTNPECSPPFKRKIFTPPKNDADSDIESVTNLLKDSNEQLLQAIDVYKKKLCLGLSNYITTTDNDDAMVTCERHIYCLTLVEQMPDGYTLTDSERKEISCLLSRWQKLKERLLKMKDYYKLQWELLNLKSELKVFKMPVCIENIVITSMENLEKDICYYSGELAKIEGHKKRLLELNVSVHRFMTENKDFSNSFLKPCVSDMYRIWHDYHFRVNERVSRLNSFLQTWQMLENRLDQLQVDLREDEHTLNLLDSALHGGSLSNQLASSVRDVAKVLSETQQGTNLPGLLIEGSFSDSGISDEGSEYELGERERRLTSIRRLVRQLESIVAPDSIPRVRMSQRLLSAEDELRSLQKRCRILVVRTAENTTTPLSDPISTGAGDPDNEPTGGPSWFRRVMQASLPFQLAIVALLCVACLLEPHCCDNMNNFAMSLTPQLRYIKGPPPI